MTQLTPHFGIEELVRSDMAERLGIDNRPSAEIVTNLGVLANRLEEVRALICLGSGGINITSGYRCPKLNYKVGGSNNSAHMQGYAADFVCPSYGTPAEIVRCISRSEVQFDQLIQEGSWVHISFAPTLRRDVLQARFIRDEPTTYRRLP